MSIGTPALAASAAPEPEGVPPPTAESAAGAGALLAPPLLASAIWEAFIEPLASAGPGAAVFGSGGAAASCASTRAADDRGQAASSNAATAQTCTARRPEAEISLVFIWRRGGQACHHISSRAADLIQCRLTCSMRSPLCRPSLGHPAMVLPHGSAAARPLVLLSAGARNHRPARQRAQLFLRRWKGDCAPASSGSVRQMINWGARRCGEVACNVTSYSHGFREQGVTCAPTQRLKGLSLAQCTVPAAH